MNLLEVSVQADGGFKAVVILPMTEVWFRLSSRGWLEKEKFERTRIGDFTLYTQK